MEGWMDGWTDGWMTGCCRCGGGKTETLERILLLIKWNVCSAKQTIANRYMSNESLGSNQRCEKSQL